MEGLEYGDDDDEYMPLGIVRRMDYSYHFPVEQRNVNAAVFVDGIDIRQCITMSNTSKARAG